MAFSWDTTLERDSSRAIVYRHCTNNLHLLTSLNYVSCTVAGYR